MAATMTLMTPMTKRMKDNKSSNTPMHLERREVLLVSLSGVEVGGFCLVVAAGGVVVAGGGIVVELLWEEDMFFWLWWCPEVVVQMRIVLAVV